MLVVVLARLEVLALELFVPDMPVDVIDVLVLLVEVLDIEVLLLECCCAELLEKLALVKM